MRELFRRQPKFKPASEEARESAGMPDDLFFKCPKCKELSYGREFQAGLHVCQKCGYHGRLGARERLDLLLDPGSFVEWDAGLTPGDPLGFATERERYPDKLRAAQRKTGLVEAALSGRGAIEGRPLAVFVTDFGFLAASMGSVYGERLVRAVEHAIGGGLPLLTVSASSGARQHEGAFALMQMAKTTAALTRLGAARLPHLSLLADPCYGGVPASYATVADVILAEPGARVGFAGPRVIEQTTKQKLPEGFQTAEFLLEHGLVDLVVPRRELRATLARFLSLYGGSHREPAQRRPGADRAVDGAAADTVRAVAGARQ